MKERGWIAMTRVRLTILGGLAAILATMLVAAPAGAYKSP